MEKPSIPQGTRDFGPAQVARRQHIFGVIRRTFETFGYAPLETPTLENLSVLTGKYGDEGDQLLFKVLNSGNFLVKERRGETTPLVTPEDLEAGPKVVLPKIAEKGLRYDLTVPFARYVAMNRGTLTFPFRRYQMQPVWRADRPQRGRYREFWQCDADVVGTTSLLCEAEIVLMMAQVFNGLGLDDFTIKINHRGVLRNIYQALGGEGQETDLFVAIDKLDKIGEDGVRKELLEKGFAEQTIGILFALLSVEGDYAEKLQRLLAGFVTAGVEPDGPRPTVETDDDDLDLTYYRGLQELAEVRDLLQASGFRQFDRLEFDPTLARGLSYYTGCIFEVKINNVAMGSVSGGGRYDNLTGSFGLPGVSGVGFSFGVDRIYDCLESLDLFTDTSETPTRVLLTHFDPASGRAALPLLAELRAAGIPAELYPDAGKLQKQFKYADAKGIPLVLILGPEELAAGVAKIKILKTGEEKALPLSEVVTALTV
ncbi:histidine--tRNA ligase [Hymenobacter sp. UV11]|uniref:histidine--tRNA ligase n=1 Tax=Hymenobacter sp. UV11 TaxID=1849735 RepID=UPI00105D8563|nr:histidine--tRNA ligase [Hymenobacter sp. UV11]TDN36468.1 histidine--tRNA ligase [Hymenobacter sp. UV11]TFZ64572.1 histidine--tRNA ligase [Hymenobacter sp. UV11]